MSEQKRDYQLKNELTDRGVSIIMVSSELPESEAVDGRSRR